jgi:SpoVK/Ycf46/Vps4 family AAA+-type ATPase
MGNVVFNFLEWVRTKAREEAEKPEHAKSVKDALGFKVIFDLEKKVEYSGFDTRAVPLQTKSETQSYSWDDFGGGEEIKHELKKKVLISNEPKDSLFFKHHGPKSQLETRGILMYGPPGTGKSYLVQIYAHNTGYLYLPFPAALIRSKYVNETANKLHSMVMEQKEAIDKGFRKGTIIYFDEIESLGMERNGENAEDMKVVTELNDLMDGIYDTSGIVFIGATNKIELMDPALIRPRRFENIVLLGVTTEDAARQIYSIHIRKWNKLADNEHPAFAPDVDYGVLARLSSNDQTLKEAIPEHRFLLTTGIVEGPNLDRVKEIAKGISRHEIPPIKFNHFMTGAAIEMIVRTTYLNKLTEAQMAGAKYEPVTQGELSARIRAYMQNELRKN